MTSRIVYIPARVVDDEETEDSDEESDDCECCCYENNLRAFHFQKTDLVQLIETAAAAERKLLRADNFGPLMTQYRNSLSEIHEAVGDLIDYLAELDAHERAREHERQRIILANTARPVTRPAPTTRPEAKYQPMTFPVAKPPPTPAPKSDNSREFTRDIIEKLIKLGKSSGNTVEPAKLNNNKAEDALALSLIQSLADGIGGPIGGFFDVVAEDMKTKAAAPKPTTVPQAPNVNTSSNDALTSALDKLLDRPTTVPQAPNVAKDNKFNEALDKILDTFRPTTVPQAPNVAKDNEALTKLFDDYSVGNDKSKVKVIDMDTITNALTSIFTGKDDGKSKAGQMLDLFSKTLEDFKIKASEDNAITKMLTNFFEKTELTKPVKKSADSLTSFFDAVDFDVIYKELLQISTRENIPPTILMDISFTSGGTKQLFDRITKIVSNYVLENKIVSPVSLPEVPNLPWVNKNLVIDFLSLNAAQRQDVYKQIIPIFKEFQAQPKAKNPLTDMFQMFGNILSETGASAQRAKREIQESSGTSTPGDQVELVPLAKPEGTVESVSDPDDDDFDDEDENNKVGEHLKRLSEMKKTYAENLRKMTGKYSA
jgi:hypothetical protein